MLFQQHPSRYIKKYEKQLCDFMIILVKQGL